MARQIIFHKYQGTENGFLIYDIRKNGGICCPHPLYHFHCTGKS